MAHRALVTGGSRGIGRAVALALAREGFDVAVGYRANAAAAEEVAAKVRAAGRRAVTVAGDAADDAEAVVDAAVEARGLWKRRMRSTTETALSVVRSSVPPEPVARPWPRVARDNPEPADAAALVAWLCSPAGGWVTGQVLVADGGYTLS